MPRYRMMLQIEVSEVEEADSIPPGDDDQRESADPVARTEKFNAEMLHVAKKLMDGGFPRPQPMLVFVPSEILRVNRTFDLGAHSIDEALLSVHQLEKKAAEFGIETKEPMPSVRQYGPFSPGTFTG